jgi:hypothetical protein
VVLVGVETLDQFRQAKQEAATRLFEAGFDLCRVARWIAQGSGEVMLQASDARDLPTECAPWIEALDPLAEGALANVQAASELAIRVTDEQLAWRPIRSLRILASGDPAMALRATESLRRRLGAQGERYAQLTRAGRSWAASDPLAGTVMLVNLARPALSPPEQVVDFVLHEYTHFAQLGINAPNGSLRGQFPAWFAEGQAEFQAKRNGLRGARGLLAAALDQRAGRTIRLGDLVREEAWVSYETTGLGDQAYARAQAAVALLHYRFGPQIGPVLLRASQGVDHFFVQLTNLTGLAPVGLERELDAWLQGLPTVQAGAPSAGLRVVLLLHPDGARTDALVTAASTPACGAGTGNGLLVSGPTAPDGTFTGLNTQAETQMLIEGRWTSPTEVSGLVRFRRLDGSCEGEPIPFSGVR